MNYSERLRNVAVLGAAGKMGSGILLLTALEMVNLKLKPENRDKTYVLHAVDVSYENLDSLLKYIREQAVKKAEKNIVPLRQAYADREELVENQHIIQQYVRDVVDVIKPTTRLDQASEASVVFEAVNEDPHLKVKLYKQIDQNSSQKIWYFTNTSSVPIGWLNKEANLEGRIIGFHFYNPPAVQKLVEMIPAEETLTDLKNFADSYASALKKVVVYAKDVAGFIGNGHLMRDALFGIAEVERLSKEKELPRAIYQVDKVTRDFMIRPMGIFQLIDYVGIDVVRFILGVMNPYFKDEDLHSDLLDKLYDKGVTGGQYPGGAQKDGFLKYEKGRPVGAFDPDKNDYVMYDNISHQEDDELGDLPKGWMPWKKMIKKKSREDELKDYFAALRQLETKGSELAIRFGKNSKNIGEKLVSQGVALSSKDVNTVLTTGFFHAYGPVNSYFD